MKSKNIVADKPFDFAVEIVKSVKIIQDNHREYVLSKQLMRSGTSIGANVRQAHNAERRKDFVHKMAIAQRECDETKYWLELLSKTNYLSPDIFNPLYKDATELLKVIRSIILSTKQNSIIS